MSNFFKASIRKLTELPWEDFRNLFTWPGTCNIQADNPNLLVAKASNESGETVAYLTAESILLVDGYTFNPQSTPEESGKAGDAIDHILSQRAGVQKIWIVVPNDCLPIEGEHILRVVERKVFQPVATAQKPAEVNQQAAYLN